MMTTPSFSKLGIRKHTLKATKKKVSSLLLFYSRIILIAVVVTVGFCWILRPSFFFSFSKVDYYSLHNNKQSRNQQPSLDSIKNFTANKEKDTTANSTNNDVTAATSSSLDWPYLPVMDDDEVAHANFWRKEDEYGGGLGRGPAIDGIDFLWQYNNNNRASSSSFPVGILFVAHGCHHSMTDWWPSTITTTTTTTTGPCPECIGLPEEVAIVDIALKLGLLVVAMSSVDRTGSQCWSKHDGPRVAQVLQGIHGYFSRRGGHDDVKILAFGASSGGHFVSSYLPKAMQKDYTNADSKLYSSLNDVAPPVRIHGYISQIAATGSTTTRHDEDDDSLPVAAVFITMNRDPRTDEKARQETLALQNLGVATRHVRLEPLPLKDDFFSSRITNVDPTTSRNMVRALQNADMISTSQEQHGDNHPLLFLRQDPRRSDWRSILAPFAARIGDSMVADESSLSEVLNVAWGMHEMTRDSVQESLEFILSQPAADHESVP